MAIYKCKMCGGNLEVPEGASSCTCDFCGTQQTIPTVRDEDLQILFNRANVLRMKSEFDKAAEIYEKILQRSETEAEAYWGLVLCKYGIEYVEDPKTFKRIPTCHRASYDSVVSDEEYKNAMKYADAAQRSIYEQQAKEIDEIQKGIIALAQKEDPYDVFICYKETDEDGKRTQDSVIANDIYYQLTREGFKVFYAAITLEDKLGSEYEPYIFAALNTAKVMLTIGTKLEYFSAVWVKNEWSRFLKIMGKDKSKLLIPCYRDMDPYELPEEFSHLQAQDMSKIGFINDLVRGIKKVNETAMPVIQEKGVSVQSSGTTTAVAQIKRGNMALEDNEWGKADSFFEEALNLDPECAEAYLGKLLAKEKMPDFDSWVSMQKEKYSSASTERLEACQPNFEHIDKMTREYAIDDFLDEETIRKEYEFDRGYDSELSCRKSQKAAQLNELASDRLLARSKQYAQGTTKKQIEEGLAEIAGVLDGRIEQSEIQNKVAFETVKANYESHLVQIDKKAKELNLDAQNRREQRYQDAVNMMNNSKVESDYEDAKNDLEAMNGYKDSNELAGKCQEEIERINEDKCQKEIDRLNEEKRREEERQAALQKEAEERATKKKKTITAIIAAAAVVCIVATIVITTIIIPSNNYNAAVALMDSGNYEAAITTFEAMDGYKNSDTQIEACQTAIKDNDYNAAVELIEYGDYITAYEMLANLDGYKNSDDIRTSIKFDYQIAMLRAAEIGDTVCFGTYEQDNNTSNGTENIEWIVLEREYNKVMIISKNALDCQMYNDSYENVTWEDCSLRKWLNETFLNEAFSQAEMEKIETTTITADKNWMYGTNAGNDTQDKVFLLSLVEAEKYFYSDKDGRTTSTTYAEKQGVYTSDDYKTADGKATCWWWLRSPGEASNYAASIDFSGMKLYNGIFVNYFLAGVRPALWINLGNK